MAFLRNVGKAFKDIVNPANYGSMFREGLGAIEAPFRNLASGQMFKSLPDFGQGMLELPLQGVLGASFLVPSLISRPDLDEAGPMEDVADRAKGLYMAAATMAPSFFNRHNMLPGLVGLIGADIGLGWAARKAGRAADYLMGTRTSPMELQDRFMGRISPRAARIREEQPNIPEDRALQLAAQELFQQVPEYAGWMQSAENA